MSLITRRFTIDPITAAILIGAATSFIQNQQNKKQVNAQRSAAETGRRTGIDNQNAVVEEGFEKRKQALGLGKGGRRNLGDVASQSGAALTSATGSSTSLLG